MTSTFLYWHKKVDVTFSATTFSATIFSATTFSATCPAVPGEYAAADDGSSPGGGNPNLIVTAQLPHFTQSHMWFLIDWSIDNHGTYQTPEDFFPDGVPW